MKKYNWLLVVVVIFVVGIGLFAGCGKKEDHTHGQKGHDHSSHEGHNH